MTTRVMDYCAESWKSTLFLCNYHSKANFHISCNCFVLRNSACHGTPSLTSMERGETPQDHNQTVRIFVWIQLNVIRKVRIICSSADVVTPFAIRDLCTSNGRSRRLDILFTSCLCKVNNKILVLATSHCFHIVI